MVRIQVSAALSLLLATSCAPTPDSTGGQPTELSSAFDTLISAGEYSLHLRVRRGDWPITVLFEAGGGADLNSWAAVPETLADRSRASIISYDRAGLGASELGPLELTPLEEIEGLRRTLRALQVPDGVVIVAHSYGGMLALLHAEAFPDDVAALVLVDPMNPRFVADVGDWLKTTVPTITNPSTNREYVVQRMTQTMDSISAHLLVVEPTLGVPMWIVSAGVPWWGPPDVNTAWTASHKAMAAESPLRRITVAEIAAHDIPTEDPETILTAITEAIEEATRSPVR